MQQQDAKNLELAQALGKAIKTLRKNKAKMSLDNFANAFGLNKGTLSTLENGLYNAKFVTVWKIAEALNMKCSDVVKILEDELGEDFKLMDE